MLKRNPQRIKTGVGSCVIYPTKYIVLSSLSTILIYLIGLMLLFGALSLLFPIILKSMKIQYTRGRFFKFLIITILLSFVLYYPLYSELLFSIYTGLRFADIFIEYLNILLIGSILILPGFIISVLLNIFLLKKFFNPQKYLIGTSVIISLLLPLIELFIIVNGKAIDYSIQTYLRLSGIASCGFP